MDTAQIALRRCLAPDVRPEFHLSNCAENGGSTTDSFSSLGCGTRDVWTLSMTHETCCQSTMVVVPAL